MSFKPHKTIQLLYKSAHYIVINKSPLCYSQPISAKSNRISSSEVTVEDLLRKDYPSLFKKNLIKPPFCTPKLVHRLDYQTTGAMVLATSSHAARMFSRGLQFGGEKGYSLRKTYIAVLSTSFEELKRVKDQPGILTWNSNIGDENGYIEGTINAPIDDKTAITNFRLYPQGSTTSSTNTTLCIFELITGRKHQLRKHSSTVLKAPILGDIRYSLNRPEIYQQGPIALHSLRLDIKIKSNWTSFFAPIHWNKHLWNGYINNDGMPFVDITSSLHS